MNKSIPNLDYTCYLDAVDKQKNTQQEWLKTGYAPPGFYLKDFCLIHKDRDFHLFHIAGTPHVSCCLPGNELWFGHATTRDFLTWQTHEPCFYIDTNGWDNGHVFAPFVIEKDGLYYLFYTGVTPENTQRIGVATSKDLFTWQRYADNPVIRPENYDWAFCPTEKGSACRDPHVIKMGNEYWLYYTAVTKQGKACVARAISTDLKIWADAGPAYVARDLKHCESATVQPFEGRYLLFFGGHIESWSCVISDTAEYWPEQDPVALGPGMTAMEVICRQEHRWLVGYFYIDRIPLSAGHRFFLGSIDWSKECPQINPVTEPEHLLTFGLG